jgi:hypothetical protein
MKNKLFALLLVGLIGLSMSPQPSSGKGVVYQDQRQTILMRVNYSRTWGRYKTEEIAARTTGQAPATIETASIKVGVFQGIKSAIKIQNSGPMTIKRIEWRLTIYDEQRRTRHDQLHLFDDVVIKPGKAAEGETTISASVVPYPKAILPQKAIILVELTKVVFEDGTGWSAQSSCKASESLSDLECSTP